MIELLFLVGGLATGVMAGLWAAHHLPARWRASTASEPRPEPPWEFDPISLDMWKRGVPGAVVLDASGATFKDNTIALPLPSAEPEPRVDVESMDPRDWRRQPS